MDDKQLLTIFPEISQIRDQTIRDACLKTWEYACEYSKVDPNQLDSIQFAGKKLKGCTIGLVTHTRNVVATAITLAEQFERFYGASIPIDLDIILCSAILHDVGKVYERCMDVNGEAPHGEGYVRHPFWGALFAEKCGCPWEVVHIINSHSWEGDKAKSTPALFIVKNADWMNFDYLFYGYEKNF